MVCGALRLLALLGVALAVQSCREDEQDRVLVYEPGTYLGQPDEPLDQEQVDALRQRATRQQF
jgi:hypothetical protein